MNNRLSISQTVHDDELRYEQLSEAIAALPPDEGIRHLKSFVSTYPSFAAVHNDLGVLYLRAGNATLSLAHHEKATRLQPDNILFRKNLADFYAVELGWLDDAADIYLEVLRRNPRDTEAMMALGKLGEAMNLKSGTAQSQLACELAPDTARIAAPPVKELCRSMDEWYSDALALANSDNVDEAILELVEFVVRYPDNSRAFNDLGILLQQKERYEDSRNYLEKALHLDPSSPLFRKNLADIMYVGFGDFEGAMKNYLELLRATPKSVDVLRAISHICIDCGMLDDAAVFMDRILEVQPWDQEVREASRKIKAIIAAPAASIAPISVKSSEELYAEVKEHLAAERVEAARDALHSLVAGSPENALAHNDLGVISLQLGDTESALRHSELAVSLAPANSNFRKNLADLYFSRLGRTDEAIFIYLDLLKSTPRDIETLINLGHICTVIGRPDEAKIFYRRAVEIEPWNREAREALQQLGK